MEMKEPNEKECLVHSRDNHGRKMSPACSGDGGEPGTSKFREFPRNCVAHRGRMRGRGGARASARIRHFCYRGKVGLIKCLPCPTWGRRENYARIDVLSLYANDERVMDVFSTFFESTMLFQRIYRLCPFAVIINVSFLNVSIMKLRDFATLVAIHNCSENHISDYFQIDNM